MMNDESNLSKKQWWKLDFHKGSHIFFQELWTMNFWTDTSWKNQQVADGNSNGKFPTKTSNRSEPQVVPSKLECFWWT